MPSIDENRKPAPCNAGLCQCSISLPEPLWPKRRRRSGSGSVSRVTSAEVEGPQDLLAQQLAEGQFTGRRQRT